MEIHGEAFRKAHRKAKVPTVGQVFGDIWRLPSVVVEGHLGPWEEQLLSQALLILRRRGLPDPQPSANAPFQNLVNAIESCEEVCDVDPNHQARRKPAP